LGFPSLLHYSPSNACQSWCAECVRCPSLVLAIVILAKGARHLKKQGGKGRLLRFLIHVFRKGAKNSSQKCACVYDIMVRLTSTRITGLFAVKLLQHICKVRVFTEFAAPSTAVVVGVDTFLG